MTPCPSTTRSVLTRTGALAVVFGTTFGLVLGPAGLALAQDAAPSTVRAVVGEDGSVKDVDRLGSDEAPGDLPVTLKIAEDGDTTSYTVENTTVQKQTVNYLGADGKPATAEQDVALPLVAQLSVRLPASRTGVNAMGARITRLADGSTELVWSMVLFGPIGSPVSEASFTAGGTGEAVSRLDVAAVQPNSTPGLSAVGQAANATVNGNGILNTIGIGANEGLVKLSDGVGKLLAGLDKLYAGAQKLNTGIEAAVDGANQLADGSEKAHAGSGELATGLGKLSDGNKALADGAKKLDEGAGKISDGLGKANTGGTQLADGSKQLATGAGAAAAGAKQLSDGLALISGGLDQVSAAQGLPAALDGAKKLRVGVEQLRAGLGAPEADGTILNGLAKVGGGLAQVKGGLTQLGDGLPNAIGGVNQIKSGIDSQILPGLGSPTAPGQTVRYALDQVRLGLAAGSADGASLDQLQGAAKLLGDALGCGAPPYPAPPSPPTNGCQIVATLYYGIAQIKTNSQAGAAALKSAGDGLTGIVAGLQVASGGLGQISGGLGNALSGVNTLRTGVEQLQAGNTALSAGATKVALGLKSGDTTAPGVAEGLDALVTGLTAAVGGVTQLAAGAKTASAGSAALADGNAKLAAGATQIADGNGALSTGLNQLFTGSKELKAGTTKLADGGKQLADGAGKAAAGSKELNAGLGKIAAGQRKVADGLPAAADGSGQIADGLGQVVTGQKQVAQGLSDVRTKAVEVLQSQFQQGTELARQQLAGLDAASAMITSTPGAATTTWVLTQAEDDSINAALASDDSDLGRNAAIGAGGALLLMVGIAGGYLSGRRKTLV